MLHVLLVKLTHLLFAFLALLAVARTPCLALLAVARAPCLALVAAFAAMYMADNGTWRTNVYLNVYVRLAVVDLVCISLSTGRYHYRQHHNHHHHYLLHNFKYLRVYTIIILLLQRYDDLRC